MSHFILILIVTMSQMDVLLVREGLRSPNSLTKSCEMSQNSGTSQPRDIFRHQYILIITQIKKSSLLTQQAISTPPNYLSLLASLSLSNNTRISFTLTGPYINPLQRNTYQDIPNHSPLIIVHEFHADLSHTTTRTGATDDFDNASEPGGMLLDMFD